MDSSKSIAQEQRLELERFKRRLIMEMLTLKREGIENVWPHLERRMGCDCQTLWDRMRKVTLKKLSRLSRVGDHNNLVPEVARMSSIDWELIDIVLVYYEVDVISATSYKNYDELRCLISVFHLVQLFDLENMMGEELARKWVQATMQYNSSERSVTPMLLQRRWFELKRDTRRCFYEYWSLYNKSLKDGLNKPSQIHISIAKTYPHIITTTFDNWKLQLESGRVAYPHMIEQVKSDPLAMPVNGKKSDDDVQLIEPVVETIDLELEGHLEYETTSGQDDASNDDVTSCDSRQDTTLAVKKEKGHLEQVPEDSSLLDHMYTRSDVELVTTIELEPDEPADDAEQSLDAALTQAVDGFAASNEPDGLMNVKIVSATHVGDTNVIDATVDDVPVPDAPVAEAPVAYAPIADVPIADVPVANSPVHDTTVGDTTVADTTVGDTTVADTTVGDTTVADTTVGDKTNADTTIDDDDDDIIMLPCDKDFANAVVESDSDKVTSVSEVVDSVIDKALGSDGVTEVEDNNVPLVLDPKTNFTNRAKHKVGPRSKTLQSEGVDEFPFEIPITSVEKPIEDSKEVIADEDDDVIQFDDDVLKNLEMEHIKIEDSYEEESTKEIKEEITKEIKEEITTEQKEDVSEYKIDKKLLMVPLVILTDMKSMLNKDSSMIKLDKELTEKLIKFSKQRPKMQYEQEEELAKLKTFIVKIYKNAAKIKRHYSPISLCKNPDFNTRLKRISASFLISAHNRRILNECKPLTIDLFNCSSSKINTHNVVDNSIDTSKFKEIPLPASSLIKLDINVTEDEREVTNTRRTKSVMLQDIDEIRRINSKIQTAEVPPITQAPYQIALEEEKSHTDVLHGLLVKPAKSTEAAKHIPSNLINKALPEVTNTSVPIEKTAKKSVTKDKKRHTDILHGLLVKEKPKPANTEATKDIPYEIINKVLPVVTTTSVPVERISKKHKKSKKPEDTFVPWYKRGDNRKVKFGGESLITTDTLAKMLITLTKNRMTKADIQFCCPAKKERVLRDSRNRYAEKIRRMTGISRQLKKIKPHKHSSNEQCNCCCAYLLTRRSKTDPKIDPKDSAEANNDTVDVSQTDKVNPEIETRIAEATLMDESLQASALENTIESLNDTLLKETETTALPRIMKPKLTRKRKPKPVDEFRKEIQRSKEMYGFAKTKPVEKPNKRSKAMTTPLCIDLTEDDFTMNSNVSNQMMGTFVSNQMMNANVSNQMMTANINNQLMSATPVNVVINDGNLIKLRLSDNTELSIDANSLAPQILQQMSQGVGGDLLLINPSTMQNLQNTSEVDSQYPNLQSAADVDDSNPRIIFSTPEAPLTGMINDNPIDSKIISIDSPEPDGNQGDDINLAETVDDGNHSAESIGDEETIVDDVQSEVEVVTSRYNQKKGFVSVKQFAKAPTDLPVGKSKRNVLNDLMKISGISLAEENERAGLLKKSPIKPNTLIRTKSGYGIRVLKNTSMLSDPKTRRKVYVWNTKTGKMAPVYTPDKLGGGAKIVRLVKKRSLLKSSQHNMETVNLDSDDESAVPDPQAVPYSQSSPSDAILPDNMADINVRELYPNGVSNYETVVTKSSSDLTVGTLKIADPTPNKQQTSFNLKIDGFTVCVEPVEKSADQGVELADCGENAADSSDDEPLVTLKMRRDAVAQPDFVPVVDDGSLTVVENDVVDDLNPPEAEDCILGM